MTAGTGDRDDAIGKPTETGSVVRPPGRIRAVLLFLTALIIGSIVYDTWAEVGNQRQAAIADAIMHARIIGAQVKLLTETAFRQADFAAQTLAHFAEAELTQDGSFGKRTRDYAESMVGEEAPFRNLVIANAKGIIIIDTMRQVNGMDINDRDFFKYFLDNKNTGIYVSEINKSRINRGWFIAVSRRITMANGSFGGIAYAVIDTGYFERYFRDLKLGPNGFLALWTGNGSIVARHPHDQELLETPRNSGEPGTEIDTTLNRSSIDGLERWVVSIPVPHPPLRITIGLAQDDILYEWERNLISHAMTAGFNVLLVCSLATFFLIYLSRFEATSGALRSAEQRSRALFDSTFGYVGMLSPDGAILSINRAFQNLAGASSTSHIGAPVWSLSPWSRAPSAMRQTREAVRHAARGDFVRFESELSSPEGIRTMDISIKPIHDEKGMVTLLVVEARDVTDRKNVENNLRVSESRVRSYFEAAMESILVTDRSGRFIDANPAACRMLGYDRIRLMSMCLADMLPGSPDSASIAASHLLHVMEAGAYRGELRLHRSDGAVRITEVSAARLEGEVYLGIFRDVTERRRDIEALRATNARVAALLRTIPDLVFLMDTAGHYLEVVAPPTDMRLAIAAERMIGRRPQDVLPPEVAQSMMQAIAETITSQHVVTTEFQLRLSDSLRWFEARFTAMNDSSNQEALVLQITRDITERVEAAERLAAAKEQAESANRAKSAFLATMSHELRTPLNAIIGFSDIMRSEMFGPLNNSRYHGYLDNIHDSGSHLLSLINDVLDISKLEAGKYALEEENINLRALVIGAYELQEAAAAANELTVNCVVPDRLPMLYGDERAVRQILLNLLSNAIKFTPTGGMVTLTIARTAEGGLALSVADTGIGIPEEAMANIAQPFHQADNSVSRRFGGTGLGLAICRNLMELHDGRLTVDSVEGNGTTVNAVFPANRIIEENG